MLADLNKLICWIQKYPWSIQSIGAGDVNGIDPLPGLIEAASQIDEVHEGDNDIGYHWGLDPNEIDEQELYEGNHICVPPVQ